MLRRPWAAAVAVSVPQEAPESDSAVQWYNSNPDPNSMTPYRGTFTTLPAPIGEPEIIEDADGDGKVDTYTVYRFPLGRFEAGTGYARQMMTTLPESLTDAHLTAWARLTGTYEKGGGCAPDPRVAVSQSEGRPDCTTGLVPVWAHATTWAYVWDRKQNAWVERPPVTTSSVNNRPLSAAEHVACKTPPAPYRLGGADRYATSAAIARSFVAAEGKNYRGNVILASGENFPDALSASYLAQKLNAPVLLTSKGRLSPAVAVALRDLGARNVVIMGGEAAVTANVAYDLGRLDVYDVDEYGIGRIVPGARLGIERIGGADRYATNKLANLRAVARGDRTVGETVPRLGQPLQPTAVVARGDMFPDALSAGLLTSGRRVGDGGAFDPKNSLPLILTRPEALVADAADQVDKLGVRHAVLVGGDTALTSGVESGLAAEGVTTQRLSASPGQTDDRRSTAAAVSDYAARSSVPMPTNPQPGLGFAGVADNSPVSATYLANGLSFPDAVAGAAYVGRTRGLLLFVTGPSGLGDVNEAFLIGRAGRLGKVLALGGAAAVSDVLLERANKLAGNG